MARGNQPFDSGITIDPFAVASFTGPDNHTGLFLDADQVNSSVLLRTNDSNAVYIDKFQNVGINNLSPSAQLDINASDGDCIKLTYNGSSNKAGLKVASDGIMTITSTGGEVNVHNTSDFNIKSHDGSSTGLKLNDTLVRASADQLNYNVVTPGTSSASKALVVDANKDITSIRNLTASQLTGTLQTAAQPNITSVGTLLGLDIDGSFTGLSTLGIATTTSGRTLVVNSDVGNCIQLCYDTTSGTATTYVDMLVSSAGDLTVTASGGNVNISSHNGTNKGLKLGGTLVVSTADQINYLSGSTPGTASGGKALIFDSSRNIGNINNLTATQLTGTLQTAAQPNINSVNVLNIANHNGSTLGLQLNGTLVTATATEVNYVDTTPGTAEASKALILDSGGNIAGITSLSATDLTGTLQTAAQTNITSVGTLDNIATSGTFTMGTTVISAAEIGVLDGVTPGTAAASKALVLNSSKGISGITSLASTSIAVGTPANSTLPVEIGYTSYQFTGAYAYSNDLNAHGMVDAGAGPSANYSLRADGRILVTGEVEITSDRRLKKDIVALTPELCKSFILTTTPVRFNWKSDDAIPDYGYIAQDVLKAGFNDLVTVVPHPDMEGSVDDDGFINPAGAKYVFSPGKIIPMVALNQRQLFEANDAKDVEIADLKERLSALEALVSQLLQK